MQVNAQQPKPGISPCGSILLLGLSLFVLSCNQGGDQQKEAQAADSATITPTTAEAGAPRMDYYNLELSVDDLKKLLNTGEADESQTYKILFQFSDENLQADNPLGLVGYGAKRNNDTTSGPVTLKNLVADQLVSGGGILGNLELSRKKLRAILGIPGGTGPIRESDLKTLYLYPFKNSDGHITYLVFTATTTALSSKTVFADGEDNSLNPSPPDPPCVTCD